MGHEQRSRGGGFLDGERRKKGSEVGRERGVRVGGGEIVPSLLRSSAPSGHLYCGFSGVSGIRYLSVKVIKDSPLGYYQGNRNPCKNMNSSSLDSVSNHEGEECSLGPFSSETLPCHLGHLTHAPSSLESVRIVRNKPESRHGK